MVNLMRFSPTWSDSGQNAAPEEAATVCDLQIFISETNVTRHIEEERKVVEGSLLISAYSLAAGIARDWWRIFGSRQEYSFLTNRMGYAFPDVRVLFDGQSFEIKSRQKSFRNPHVNFFEVAEETTTRQVSETILANFIKAVTSRLNDVSISETEVQLQWELIANSLQDEDEKKFCEAAGALGRNPYLISDNDAHLITQASALFKGEPLIEFLAGIGSSNASTALEWIRDTEGRKSYRNRFSDLADIARRASDLSPPKECERSWALGYRRARALRRVLDVNQSDRFANVKSLAQRLGSKTFSFTQWVEGIHALVTFDESRGDTYLFLRDRSSSAFARHSHLFAFGRALGEAVCFPNTDRSIVNDLHEASHQAAGRAFAAEFLAPIDEVLSMKQDGRDNASIAEDFKVSTVVIERQIENSHRISEACST